MDCGSAGMCPKTADNPTCDTTLQLSDDVPRRASIDGQSLACMRAEIDDGEGKGQGVRCDCRR